MKKIKAYWYKNENNFGDMLTPWLIKHIAGAEAEFDERDSDEQKHVTAGSILDNHIKNSIVWGTGIARATDKVSLCHQDIRAVRGPISAKMVLRDTGKAVSVIGDPGIVIRKFYTPGRARMANDHMPVGILPHYVDYAAVNNMNLDPNYFKVLDITAGVDKLLDEISECSKVFSSSLHGIIASHSLRVPASWIKLSNKVLGDDTKFYDYYESLSVCREQVDLLDLRGAADDKKIEIFKSHSPAVSDIRDEMIDALLSVCPFKKL
jgi:pyruvyltransferase